MTSNVRDFGAVGDGRTDDSEAFLKAAAAVNPAGGVLYVPAGAASSAGYATRRDTCMRRRSFVF